jgi:hypothetical protein
MPLKLPNRRLDNSYFRSVYLGLIYEFTNSVVLPGYEQFEPYDETKPSQTELERQYNDVGRILVPFFMNMGFGAERFMQDAFLLGNIDPKKMLYTDSCAEKIAEGNYDPIPRGIITPSGISINSGARTNPYVRGKFFEFDIKTQEWREYSTLINNLPMSMPCTGQIIVDNQNDAWLIAEYMIYLYNKVRPFSYTFKGLRGEGQFKIGNDTSIDRLFEFTYPEENRIIINFDIEVEAIMPIFDPYKKFDSSNVINNLENNLSIEGIPPERIPTNPDLAKMEFNNFM